MIAVDTNILVHASRAESPRHEAALSALRSLAEGAAAWAIPVFALGEYLRVVTHPRVFSPPTPSAHALDAIDALLESPSVRVLSPGPRFPQLLREATLASGATGNLVFDAEIAAVCLEHGARTLLTEDRDFERFPGLRSRTLSQLAAER